MRRLLHRQCFRAPLLTGAILSTALVGTALAASNSISVSVPAHAKVNQKYSIGIKGHAAKTEKLYMFNDFLGCKGSPAAEHKRANGDIWTVRGNFQVVSKGWRSPKAHAYHACTYLVKASEPPNPSGGILAHNFKRFTVHS